LITIYLFLSFLLFYSKQRKEVVNEEDETRSSRPYVDLTTSPLLNRKEKELAARQKQIEEEQKNLQEERDKLEALKKKKRETRERLLPMLAQLQGDGFSLNDIIDIVISEREKFDVNNNNGYFAIPHNDKDNNK
jgi:hypothetical protein